MAFDPPTLPPSFGIEFQIWWQQVLEGLQAELGALAAAQAAQATATAAQTTATTVQRDDAIADSYTVPGTPLSATDAGANATITVANHNRVYNDGTTVAVTGGNLTGKAYSTTCYIYYDQTSRAGGAVTYVATTDAKAALPGAAAGRHYVGKIVTPAAAGAPTSGGSNPPAGGGGGGGGVGGAEVF